MKKNVFKLVSICLVMTSCASDSLTINKNKLFEESNPVINRNIASSLSGPVFVTAIVETNQICSRSFDTVFYKSSNPDYKIEMQTIKKFNSGLEYMWPKKLVSTSGVVSSNKIEMRQTKSVALKNPPVPILPIISTDASPEQKTSFCNAVKKYHFDFTKSKLVLKPGVPDDDGAGGPKDTDPIDTDPPPPPPPPVPPYVSPTTAFNQNTFIIFYADQYQKEIKSMAQVYSDLGYDVKIQKVSEISGVNPNQFIPDECSGTRMIECYHRIGDPQSNVSGEGISALKGFYTKFQGSSQLIPYLPGLIRAEIRKQKKLTGLAGILLVGNTEELATFFYPWIHYGETEPDQINYPPAYINTDLFYILPDPELELMPITHHTKPTAYGWTCKNSATGELKRKLYCDADDVRFWDSVNPIASQRWQPRMPSSRIFRIKNLNSYNIQGNALFNSYTENDVIPVGRIVTQNDLYKNDPIVAKYIQKIARWHNELPSFEGNSIATYGGTPGDYWTFLDTDITQFKNTFGLSSKQYSSEYFTPLTQCQGICQYKSTPEIMNELSEKNHTSLYMTGHGGESGIQSPYPTGYNPQDLTLNFSSENYYRLMNENIQVKLQKITSATHTTVKNLNNAGLIGHVVANSCHLSDINYLNLGWNLAIQAKKSDANQRSFAEQLIQVENGGAMNTFLNSDVGYGYTDDHYNQKFMINSKKANDRCGTIGDALRMTVMDMIKGNNNAVGTFQLVNRQFLGSPINKIALLPRLCDKTISTGGPRK